MKTSVEDVKRQLSRKYLGKSGIHGVGINASRDVIQVHLQTGQEEEQEKLREELEKAAAPYKVVLIPDEPPKIT